jgi:hypothetical protein
MSDPQTPSSFPLPPAPPPSAGAVGCLRYALFGGGGVLALMIVAALVLGSRGSRGGEALGFATSETVRQGARFGLRTDEAGCLAEAERQAAEAPGVMEGQRTREFLRSCLEYSYPTDGFCEDVPGPEELRRTTQWQEERCDGQGAECAQRMSVVQTFCAPGSPARTAEDTLYWYPRSPAVHRLRDSLVDTHPLDRSPD